MYICMYRTKVEQCPNEELIKLILKKRDNRIRGRLNIENLICVSAYARARA